MSKEIKYDQEAILAVEKGINTVADIVKTTVGPRGRNVLIREEGQAPIITNDGVTIAKSIKLKDNIEDAGASLVISAANKTNSVAGDGTTTTTILTQALINEYNKIVSEDKVNNINPVQIQKEMLQAGNVVNDYLLNNAIPAKDIESIKRVATISSGDEHIGDLIAKAFEQAGEYGTVMIEDSKLDEDTLETVEGMRFNNGMMSNYLLNDRITMKTNYTDCKVLVTSEIIDNIVSIMPLLDMCIKQNLRLLILCEDMDPVCLNTIIMNRAQGLPINIAIVKLPGFGQLKEDLTNDICLATGANLISKDKGRTLNEVSLEDLGEVKEVIVTLDNTTLKFKDCILVNMDNTGEHKDLLLARQNKAIELKERLKEAKENEQTQLKRRISNLISGIAAIKVAGNSEIELKDKKLRIEDALNSVESAKEEGIVPGGGYSFIKASEDLQEKLNSTIGGKVVKQALLVPTKQIADNAGQDGNLVVNNCIEKHLGYNAITDTYEDLLQAGVINSVKTDRYSILNAVSVASTVITMGGLIVEENEKDPNVLQLAGPINGIVSKM